ncbi:hypothetical protein [Streptomyces hoynatensis]|uniref:Uncharacterized protein n=1 Tax=Streptomyces hoynatensis TaxID=1141874 RepID=A0A3A9YI70_9ACTN|nr:hypothetical protein [Streptomyces hoynatensis]RKN36775.1 hypothetical protein D7294_29650 [Streptomyces hoynatensis]
MVFLMLWFYPIIRNARHLTLRFFPQDAGVIVHDALIANVKRLRWWAAVVVVVAAPLFFDTEQDAFEIISESYTQYLFAPFLIIVTAPAVVAVFVFSSAPHARPALRASLRDPLRTLITYIGAVVVSATVTAYAYAASDSTNPLLALVVLAAALWSLSLFVFASIAVVRTGFGLGKVNAALPALLTSILVWEWTVLGGLPSEGTAIDYLLILGGPTTVTAIAYWEIHRLRTVYGVTLRIR